MNFRRFSSWLNDLISPELRLRKVTFWYLLSLMVSTRKHSLIGAAEFSGIHKSQFSRFLLNHAATAVRTLEDLSKKQAKRISDAMNYLAKGAIPCKKYCREHGLAYKTENELVVDYINRLDLEAFIGKHNPKEVVVLADSGYDDKKIENAISTRKWRFIIATKKTRSVKSQAVNSTRLQIKGVDSYIHAFQESPRGQVADCSYRYGWSSKEANGFSHKTNRWLSALRGQSPTDLFGIQKEASGPTKILGLQ